MKAETKVKTGMAVLLVAVVTLAWVSQQVSSLPNEGSDFSSRASSGHVSDEELEKVHQQAIRLFVGFTGGMLCVLVGGILTLWGGYQILDRRTKPKSRPGPP